MDNLNNTSQNLYEENIKLRQNVNELELTLQELVRQDALIDKWTVMKNFVLVSTEVERLSMAYVSLEKQYQQLINTSKNDVYISEQKLKTAVSQLEELNSIMIQQQTRIKELNINYSQTNDQLKKLKQINESMQETNKKLTTNQQSLIKDKQVLQQKVNESNEELNQVMQTLKECEDIFKVSLEKQDQVIHNLEKQCEHLNYEVQKKDKNIDQLMKKNQELINDVERIDAKYIEQSIQMKKISKIYEQLELEYKNYKETQEANKQEFYSLTKRLENKNSILIDIENKQDKLTYIVKSLETQLEEKEFKLKQSKDKISELLQELDKIKGNTQNIKQTNEKEIIDLNSQVKRLQEKIEELKIEYEQERSQKQFLQQTLDNQNMEVEKQIQQINLLKNESNNYQKVIFDLHQALNVQKDMFQKVKLESASLRDSLLQVKENNITMDLMKWEDQCETLRNECQQWQREAQYYKHQNYQLCQQIEDLKQTKAYLSNILMQKNY